MASPVRYGARAAVVLGVLAIPVFSMRLGFADAGNDGPTSTTTRKAYDLIADGYGPGANGPFQVVVEHDGGDRCPAHACSGSQRPAQRQPVSPRWRAGDQRAADLAIIDVTPTTAPQDEDTSELLAAPARRRPARRRR